MSTIARRAGADANDVKAHIGHEPRTVLDAYYDTRGTAELSGLVKALEAAFEPFVGSAMETQKFGSL